MKRIQVSRHAKRRARQRHPDYTIGELSVMAALARSCGATGPGKNGCRRYKYLGREFVFDEKQREPVLVTVV